MKFGARVLMRTTCAAIFLSGATAAGAQSGSPGGNKARQAIISLEHEWLDVRDTTTLRRILADDFVHVLPMGFISKSDEIAFREKHGWPSSVEQKKFEDLTVRLYGQMAIANGVVAATNVKTHAVRRTRFTDVFVYRSGRWQAVNAQELAAQ